MRKLYSLLTVISLCFIQTTMLWGQQKLSGNWEGAINIQGTELKIIAHFTTPADTLTGTLDIPQQGAQDLPLETITVNNADAVSFSFYVGMGMAEFRGQFKNDSTITGTYHQNGRQFPFRLIQYQSSRVSVKTMDSVTMVPYNQRELVIENDSVAIGGTLTWPKDKQTDELVIIISGSGAQNRNGKLPITDFKPYQALAKSLTPKGIATFRYDDRGVGESTGNFSTAALSTLASDVDAVIKYFQSDTSPSFSTITLLGHSQGGVVAGRVAAQNKSVDKLILMASPGLPLKELLRYQVQQAFARAGVDSSLIEQEISARESIMDAIRSGENLEQPKENYQNQFAAIQLAMGMDSTQAVSLAKRQADQLSNTFESAQTRSLLHYDPTDDLRELNIPVLVLFGGKDTQVPVRMNQLPVKQALESAGTSYETVVFEQANHLFQNAKTGDVQEYATLESAFVDGLIETLSEWIK